LLVINFNRRQLLMEIVVCKPSGYWLAIHCVHLNTLFLFTAILALRYLLMNRFRATKSAGVNSFAQIKKDLKPYMGQ
jgi:hypothetical protein